MSAELVQVEDPNDPEVILRDLPERERAQFLRRYHEAVDAAHDLAGYRQLQRGSSGTGRGRHPRLAGATGGGAGPAAVIYRAELLINDARHPGPSRLPRPRQS
jgi:hypothetical protein